MAAYNYENIDSDLDKADEPSKAGFVARWVGVANSTATSFTIETNIDCAVPDTTLCKNIYKAEIYK